jgi:DNA-binding GntR family transcriptional regulator
MPDSAWAVPGVMGIARHHYLLSMINWVPDPERPLWLQLMETLRGRILDGTYAPRTKLPSLKQLTQEFEVGLNTARHAISDLEGQGYVRAVKSLGTFVTPREEWPQT